MDCVCVCVCAWVCACVCVCVCVDVCVHVVTYLGQGDVALLHVSRQRKRALNFSFLLLSTHTYTHFWRYVEHTTHTYHTRTCSQS